MRLPIMPMSMTMSMVMPAAVVGGRFPDCLLTTLPRRRRTGFAMSSPTAMAVALAIIGVGRSDAYAGHLKSSSKKKVADINDLLGFFSSVILVRINITFRPTEESASHHVRFSRALCLPLRRYLVEEEQQDETDATRPSANAFY